MLRTVRKFLLIAVAAAAVSVGAFSPQPANAAALSTSFVNKFVDGFLRGQTLPLPTTVFVGLATTAGSAAGCGTEVSTGSYTRVAVASSPANWAATQSAGSTVVPSNGTSGQTSNNVTITFPAPTAPWGSIVGGCVFDAATGGNLLFFFPLTTAKTVNSGDSPPSFAVSALAFTIQ